MNSIRNVLKSDFSQIPNELIIDMSLSAGALRVLLYLFTKPDYWKVYNDDICNKLQINEKTLTKYWKELLSSRWLRREKLTGDDGKFTGGHIYHIGTFTISPLLSDMEKVVTLYNNKPQSNTINLIQESKFKFTLTQLTTFSNLSALYKQQLEKEINTLQGNMSYEEFALRLEAKEYKYKNFLSAYKLWSKNANKYSSPKQKNTNSVTLEERIEEAERRKQEGIERWEKENGL